MRRRPVARLMVVGVLAVFAAGCLDRIPFPTPFGGGPLQCPQVQAYEPDAVPLDDVELDEAQTQAIRERMMAMVHRGEREWAAVLPGPDGCPPGFELDVLRYLGPMQDLEDAASYLEQLPPGLRPDTSDLREALDEQRGALDRLADGEPVCLPVDVPEVAQMDPDELHAYFCGQLREAVEGFTPEQREVANPIAICGVRG